MPLEKKLQKDLTIGNMRSVEDGHRQAMGSQRRVAAAERSTLMFKSSRRSQMEMSGDNHVQKHIDSIGKIQVGIRKHSERLQSAQPWRVDVSSLDTEQRKTIMKKERKNSSPNPTTPNM